MQDRKNWQEILPEDAIEQCNFLFRPVNFGYSGYEKMTSRLREGGDLFVFNHFMWFDIDEKIVFVLAIFSRFPLWYIFF